MKEIAKLRITDADPRIKELSSHEINSKIDLIYSLGYIYNPYDREFYNPFIHMGLKGIIVYNLTPERIVEVHRKLEAEFLAKNQRYRTLGEISEHFNVGRFSPFRLVIESLTGLIGILCLGLAILLHIWGNIGWAAGNVCLSFVLLRFYVNFNSILRTYEGEWILSRLWKNYHAFFLILSLAIYPYFYYLFYLLLADFFLPVPIVLLANYIVNKASKYYVSLHFWWFLGWMGIEQYALSNNLR